LTLSLLLFLLQELEHVFNVGINKVSNIVTIHNLGDRVELPIIVLEQVVLCRQEKMKRPASTSQCACTTELFRTEQLEHTAPIDRCLGRIPVRIDTIKLTDFNTTNLGLLLAFSTIFLLFDKRHASGLGFGNALRQESRTGLQREAQRERERERERER
jgi:hypothetical protein